MLELHLGQLMKKKKIFGFRIFLKQECFYIFEHLELSKQGVARGQLYEMSDDHIKTLVGRWTGSVLSTVTLD